MCRADQVAIVPLSQATIASSRSRLPSSQATTCGFIGDVGRGSRAPPSAAHQSFIAVLRLLQEAAVVVALAAAAAAPGACRGCRRPARPRPGSAGRSAVGSMSIWTPRAWPGFGKNSMYGNDVPTISSVSQLSIASCDGCVPSSPMPPVVYGLSSGHGGLAEQRLDDRRGERLGQLLQLVGRAKRAAAGQDRDLLAGVQDVGGPLQVVLRRAAAPPRASTSEVWPGTLRFERCARRPGPGGRPGR